MEHISESSIAINRASRIALRASSPDADDYLAGWLLGSLQRWWMMHRRLVTEAGVRDVFADAVESSLRHLERTDGDRRVLTGFVASLRDSEPAVRYAVARALVVHLGLDPDATVLSQHLSEWDHAPTSVEGDTDDEAATYLASLTRQSIILAADPDTSPETREEIIATAYSNLRHIACTRSRNDDLWTAVTAGLHAFPGDDDLTRLARLSYVVETLKRRATSDCRGLPRPVSKSSGIAPQHALRGKVVRTTNPPESDPESPHLDLPAA
jgi:hypothetical protein